MLGFQLEMLISKRGGWFLALGALVTRVLWSTLHSLQKISMAKAKAGVKVLLILVL